MIIIFIHVLVCIRNSNNFDNKYIMIKIIIIYLFYNYINLRHKTLFPRIFLYSQFWENLNIQGIKVSCLCKFFFRVWFRKGILNINNTHIYSNIERLKIRSQSFSTNSVDFLCVWIHQRMLSKIVFDGY